MAPLHQRKRSDRIRFFNGAKARAVTTSHGFCTDFPKFLDSHVMDDGRHAGCLPPPAGTPPFCHCFQRDEPGPVCPASAQAIGIPGNPPPEPKSTQTLAVRRQTQQLERIGDVARPQILEASTARPGSLLLCQRSSSVYEAIEPRFRFT